LVAKRHPKLEIHMVLDNYRTHKHPVVREWLEANPRFHLQVETWFSILQRKTIRRGVFRSVGSLQSAVHRFIDAWNDPKKPFAWVRTSDEILAKAIPKAISAGLH
jgi:hypothetical protein